MLDRRPAKKQLAFMLVPKTEGRSPLAVLHREKQLGIKWRGQQVRKPRPSASQAVGSKESAINQRLVHKIPRMWVSRIQTSEFAEELSRLDLQVVRQRHRFQVSF